MTTFLRSLPSALALSSSLIACGSATPSIATPSEVTLSEPLASDEGMGECDPEALGEPSMFTLAGQTLHSAEIGAPEVCETENGSYIPIRHSGQYELRMPQGQPATGCSHAGQSDCEWIDANAFFQDAFQRAEQANLQILGVGRGPCGDTGEYDSWNYSIMVRNWANVNALVEILAERAEAWGVDGQVGAAVEGETCGVLLEGE